MIIAGLMTGTSADALDLALVRFRADPPDGGDDLHLELLAYREVPLPEDLRRDVLRLLEPDPVSLGLVARVDAALGRFSGRAVQTLLQQTGLECDLVVSHGQTVQHLLDGDRVAGSLQIGQPAWIVEATGCPVVSDLRAADVAAGGQGAPLAGTLDTLLLGQVQTPTAALNLGGIANITVVAPGADPLSYDTGPANALVDLMARRITDGAEDCDRDGHLAASGHPDPALLEDLLAEPYYARPAPKSTGKELFHAGYLDAVLARHPGVAPRDVVATLTVLTARTVADACRAHGVTLVHASGGGTRNPALMAALAAELGPQVTVAPTQDLGLPADAKEAVLMALLGWLTWHGLPGTLPACTGAHAPRVAGRITPGAEPLRLPEPAHAPPRRLRITSAPSVPEGEL